MPEKSGFHGIVPDSTNNFSSSGSTYQERANFSVQCGPNKRRMVQK